MKLMLALAGGSREADIALTSINSGVKTGVKCSWQWHLAVQGAVLLKASLIRT